MYKVYINKTPLYLTSFKKVNKLRKKSNGGLVARYPGKTKMLLNYIDMLEKSGKFESVMLYCDNKKKLIVDFESCFEVVQAAGGLVYNDKGKVLLIFRHGIWDLPKGKFEQRETKKECAVREVMEETGIDSLQIRKKMTVSYHTFRNSKNRRKLKKVYWYRMFTRDEVLVPQLDEGIEEARWWDLPEFLHSDLPVYGNIRDILRKELSSKK